MRHTDTLNDVLWKEHVLFTGLTNFVGLSIPDSRDVRPY